MILVLLWDKKNSLVLRCEGGRRLESLSLSLCVGVCGKEERGES